MSFKVDAMRTNTVLLRAFSGKHDARKVKRVANRMLSGLRIARQGRTCGIMSSKKRNEIRSCIIQNIVAPI